MNDDLQIEIDGIQREVRIERKETNFTKYKIYPDMTIRMIIPESMTNAEAGSKIVSRKHWIKKHLEFYSKFQEKGLQQYTSGSSFYYLGKQYRIKLIKSEIDNVKLSGKFLVISTKKLDLEHLEALVERWYKSHAVDYFNKVVDKCLMKLRKYEIDKPNLNIRKFKSRWGSCIKSKNKIILNSNLIKESSLSIEFVIMHELCHLKFPNHNNSFYSFLSIVMPDWRFRKSKLERLSM